jgi:molybdopterin synthase catalytic subunit
MAQVSVRLFAHFRDRAGADAVTVQLPDRATVAAVRACLGRLWPDAAGLLQKSAVAVNEEYAPDDCELAAGDDVALIPPVSGG